MRFREVPEQTRKLELSPLLDHYDVMHRPDHPGEQMLSCPLHPDRNPSMRVNVSKGVWFCHSCGETGTGIDLIKLKEGLDVGGARAFAAALGIAAGDAGGSDEIVRGSSYGGRRSVPSRSGDRPGNSRYVPPWRRG